MQCFESVCAQLCSPCRRHAQRTLVAHDVRAGWAQGVSRRSSIALANDAWIRRLRASARLHLSKRVEPKRLCETPSLLSRVKRKANRCGQLVQSVWFRYQRHTFVQPALMEDDIARVTGREDNRRPMWRSVGNGGQFA